MKFYLKFCKIVCNDLPLKIKHLRRKQVSCWKPNGKKLIGGNIIFCVFLKLLACSYYWGCLLIKTKIGYDSKCCYLALSTYLFVYFSDMNELNLLGMTPSWVSESLELSREKKILPSSLCSMSPFPLTLSLAPRTLSRACPVLLNKKPWRITAMIP